MVAFSPQKVVGGLPPTLTPNALYVVRVGEGITIYVADATGSVAYPMNQAGDVWTGWTWLSLMVLPKTGVTGSAVVSGVSGTVTEFTWQGNLAYRFKPSNGSKSLDGFYRTFISGVLSGLITTRG